MKNISIIRIVILSLGILIVGGMLFFKQDQLNHARDIIDVLQNQLESCNPVETNRYENAEFNISFEYPSNWGLRDGEMVGRWVGDEVVSEEEKFEHAVVLKTSERGSIYFDYDAMSFDEFEAENASLIEENFMSIREVMITGQGNEYTSKEYGQHGGLGYFIELDGRFVRVVTESYLSSEEQEGLVIILDSLSY